MKIASILSNKDVKLNPEALDDLKNLMKLGLSNKAQFFKDGNVAHKVKALEDKIAKMLMDNPEYREGFTKVIRKKGIPKPKPKSKEEKPKIEIKPRQSIMDKIIDVLQQDKNKNIPKEEEKNQDILGDEELQDKNKLLTYLSPVTEPEAFQKVFEDIKPEIGSFVNNIFEAYKPVINKILEDKQNKIKDLALKTAINPSGNKIGNENEKDNGLVEPFNLNNLNDGEKECVSKSGLEWPWPGHGLGQARPTKFWPENLE